MEQSVGEQRAAFVSWLRTGLWPVARVGDLEVKFNPYHDPRNERFTFAPGGSRGNASYVRPSSGTKKAVNVGSEAAALTAAGSRAELRRGGNSRAFEDPMTLEQAFPGLGNTPGGAIVAAADTVLNLYGPANEMTAQVLQQQAKVLISQIEAVDPAFHYDELGPTDALGTPIVTLQGLSAKVNDLRFLRAAVLARVQGDYGPLQVETLRFVQERADAAYARGQSLLKAGNLKPVLSEQEALGNFVDRDVRQSLRRKYNQLGIDSAGKGPVRVNRRENDNSENDLAYRRPDARVKDVAFDVTLTRKTLATPQIRGFFNADFRPSRVVIIRPSQFGAGHTYVISRPEKK